jgi:hypothetical protein
LVEAQTTFPKYADAAARQVTKQSRSSASIAFIRVQAISFNARRVGGGQQSACSLLPGRRRKASAVV